MRKLLVFLLAFAAYGLNDYTAPQTFYADSIIRDEHFNENNDSLEAIWARLQDSVDGAWIRFTDLTSGDTILTRVNVDTLGSNPVLDSVAGLDVMRGNPDLDSAQIQVLSALNSLAGNPTADSLVVSILLNATGRISTDSIEGLDNLAGNPTADSLVVSELLNVTGLINTDTVMGLAVLAGNPILDSAQQLDVLTGNPLIDSAQINVLSAMNSIRGNPDCDSISGSPTIGTNPTVDGNLLFSGDGNITSNTSDASDNATMYLSGGGEVNRIRGATIELWGNESGSPGLLDLNAGQVSGGKITMVGPIEVKDTLDIDDVLNVGSGADIDSIDIVDSTNDSLVVKIGAKVWVIAATER